jgi:predicted permease
VDLFITVVLPTIVIFAIGYALMKKFEFDLSTLSNLTFYALLPLLVFKTLYGADLKGDVSTIFLFEGLLILTLILFVKILVWIRRASDERESALMLSIAFMNTGNYGAPILLFAYGQAAFEYGITFWVLNSILMNTVGVYYASKHEGGFVRTLTTLAKNPTIYAALLGAMLNAGGVVIPEPALRPILLLASATIPILMLMLGMQLANVKISKLKWDPIMTSVTARLLLSPLIAWGLVKLLSIEGILAKSLILEAAMPSAVVTTLLAIQYNREPDVVSNATWMSTLLSVVTLSILLNLLGV